jgi:hypothetical protein
MTATFDYQYERAYKVSSQWNTIIDEVFSGKEQRRNQWSASRKKWVLTFDVLESDVDAILAFFDARKGRYEAFNWVWQETHPTKGNSMGGDGETYLVRFDSDELNFEHAFNGGGRFSITFVEVKNS